MGRGPEQLVADGGVGCRDEEMLPGALLPGLKNRERGGEQERHFQSRETGSHKNRGISTPPFATSKITLDRA